MDAPDSIYQLIEKFDRDKPGSEDEVQQYFVDPLFEALGWDMRDKSQVRHEPSVIVQEAGLERSKRADYSFHIGNTRHFFVETKMPHRNLKRDSTPAFQLRRYGYSGKTPVSILTDFEEFCVYHCQVRPYQNDPASKARLRYWTYENYVDDWDEIESRFSREAVAQGALREWIEGERIRGASSVDKDFLGEMEKWRELLAKTIALHNRDLSQRQLNLLVQRTIDRMVFLRIAEDRDIEAYGRLRSAAEESRQVYEDLKILFNEADDKYNSGLFHFGQDERASDPDRDSLNIHIPDEPLRHIIKNLYFPDSPFEFSVMPPEILGQVYEQFLGKVIELSPSGAARVEQKPEVRKAGGVYYTPTYIVDYIVENTVGELLKGKSPADAEKLRILDPACGSGSFLVGAYQYLLDWHLETYSREPDKNKNVLRRIVGGWVLTTAEKRRILCNNIYGVDLDQNAVEVSKLSLLLKMLENESDAAGRQTLMFAANERILPDLSDNIKWGNSLIGSDFYDDKQARMFNEEERLRVKFFDWDSEDGFGEIMRKGGFDTVIGNPPYIRIQTMKETAPETVPYYKQNYVSASKGNYDIYVVFVEKALQLLNREGLLGFILPHKFFNAKYGEPLRQLIAKGNHLKKIVHFGAEQVFAGATTYTCLLFLDRQTKHTFDFVSVPDLHDWHLNKKAESGRIPISRSITDDWIFVVGPVAAIYDRLNLQPVKLNDVSKPFVGLQTSADTVFLFKDFKEVNQNLIEVHSKSLNRRVEIEKKLLKPVIRSGNIGRFWAIPSAYVLFPYRFILGKAQLISQAEMKQRYPLTWSYLMENKILLSGREHGKFAGDGWYQLYPKNLELWERPKLMMPYMITQLSAYLDLDNMYFVNVTTGGFGLTFEQGGASLKYFVGLLNSKLLDLYLKQVSPNFRGGYFGANKRYLDRLPIRTIDFDNPADVAMHDKMVEHVDKMLNFHKELPDSAGEARRILNAQIQRTDREIDGLVYRLYGLSEDEVAIVEGG